MARYKHYDSAQTTMVPVSLEKQLMPGTLEFAIHILGQRYIDTTIFESRYQNDDTGCPAYDPKILLKVYSCVFSRPYFFTKDRTSLSREYHVYGSGLWYGA
jgi:hypothetical protein